MEQFHRGERIAQVSRLKKTRKHYWNVWIKDDPKQLSRVVQYPAMCSCSACSATKNRRIHGNAQSALKATEQSVIQLLNTELLGS